MDRTNKLSRRTALAAVLGLGLITQAGCIHQILATGLYLVHGGNFLPAEYDGLENQRVVVVCRPPTSHEYRHAGAARGIARRTSGMLASNVKMIDVVESKEVDNWADESDWDDFKELGRAVKADKLVHIEMDNFSLNKGRTVYQGNAEITVSVYDMNDGGKLVWEKSLGQILYPRHSGIPAQDKPVSIFQKEFEEIVAEAIAVNFYKHDPNNSFAIDALANR